MVAVLVLLVLVLLVLLVLLMLVVEHHEVGVQQEIGGGRLGIPATRAEHGGIKRQCHGA